MSRSKILARLAQFGIQPTPQRLKIARILFRKPQHLSVDQIVQRLNASRNKISRATVYNTLNLFVKQGMVKERIIDPERRFYDSTITPHHHFFNVDTGELTDFADDHIELSALPSLPEGTELESTEFVIRIRNAIE